MACFMLRPGGLSEFILSVTVQGKRLARNVQNIIASVKKLIFQILSHTVRIRGVNAWPETQKHYSFRKKCKPKDAF